MPGQPLKRNHLGEFKNVSQGFQIAADTPLSMWERRGDFGGLVVRATCVLYDNYCQMDEKGEFDGLDVDILDILAEKFNFRVNLTPSIDSTFGIQAEDGTWSGVMGMLNKNESDYAIGPSPASTLRLQGWALLTFSPPHTN